MHRSLRKRLIEEWRGLPEPDEEVDRTVSIRTVLGELATKRNVNRSCEKRRLSAHGEKSSATFSRGIPGPSS